MIHIHRIDDNQNRPSLTQFQVLPGDGAIKPSREKPLQLDWLPELRVAGSMSRKENQKKSI